MPARKRALSDAHKDGQPRKCVFGTTNLLTQHTPPTALDLLDADRYPILGQVCGDLAVDSMVALSKTCRQLNRQMPRVIQGKRNIDDQLRQFVDDPRGLRACLGQHNAPISGSFALQFFTSETWPRSDLDIFVQDGSGIDMIANHIMHREGYRLEDSRDKQGYAMRDLVQVRPFSAAPIHGTDHPPTNSNISAHARRRAA